jgi:hypothetical protein
MHFWENVVNLVKEWLFWSQKQGNCTNFFEIIFFCVAEGSFKNA